MLEDKKYEVALSFAGEDRTYVDEVAMLLKKKGINVFYDKYEETELWGKNLYDHLSDVYKNKAQYTIIFVSRFYAEKLWTNLERQNAQARAFSETKEYILPAKFDDTEITGIQSTVGYIDLRNRTPLEFVDIVYKKLHDKSFDDSNQIKQESYICPFCGTSVHAGKTICLGCKAELAYSSTRKEKMDDFQIGLSIGGILTFILLFTSKDFITKIINITTSSTYELKTIWTIWISISVALFSGFLFAKRNNRIKRENRPRFFRNTML